MRRAVRLSALAAAAWLCLGANSAWALMSLPSLTSFTVSVSPGTVNLGQGFTVTVTATGDSADGAPNGFVTVNVWREGSSASFATALCSGARTSLGDTSTYTCNPSSTNTLGGGGWIIEATYKGGTNYTPYGPAQATNNPVTVLGPTYTVNTLTDSNDASDNCDASGTGTQCSLRDAINESNVNSNGGTIAFQAGLTGTITLGSSLPVMDSALVTINGPGANLLTVSGGGNYQIFQFGADSFMTAISGLTIAEGYTSSAYDGGGITYGRASVDGGELHHYRQHWRRHS